MRVQLWLMAVVLTARPAGIGETGWLGRWSPGIGDPTMFGWVIVAGYLVAAWLCYRASAGPSSDASHEGAAAWRERLLWRILVGVIIALGINKQLDLQSGVTELLRIAARGQGWYRFRREYQAAFIAALAIVTVIGWGSLVAFSWTLSRSVKIAGFGLCMLGAFVVMRAASFHHVDALFRHRVLSLKLEGILELGGIGVIAFGAVQRMILSSPARPAAVPRVQARKGRRKGSIS